MRKRYSRSYTVLSFLTMFSYRELPFAYRLFSVMGSLPSADNSDLFFDLGSLADSVAQVEQLCASYLTVTDNFDTCNVGRVDRESLFDTATVGNTSYGECLGDAATALSDNGSVKKLDSLTVAFLNTAGNTNGVAHFEFRKSFL